MPTSSSARRSPSTRRSARVPAVLASGSAAIVTASGFCAAANSVQIVRNSRKLRPLASAMSSCRSQLPSAPAPSVPTERAPLGDPAAAPATASASTSDCESSLRPCRAASRASVNAADSRSNTHCTSWPCCSEASLPGAPRRPSLETSSATAESASKTSSLASSAGGASEALDMRSQRSLAALSSRSPMSGDSPFWAAFPSSAVFSLVSSASSACSPAWLAALAAACRMALPAAEPASADNVVSSTLLRSIALRPAPAMSDDEAGSESEFAPSRTSHRRKVTVTTSATVPAAGCRPDVGGVGVDANAAARTRASASNLLVSSSSVHPVWPLPEMKPSSEARSTTLSAEARKAASPCSAKI
mmetsp:Transcript_64236/g.139760  ORF Transcript_64236/g.139760 Transcript_64236/m.139760 type:complete len:360 (-) Transcript_64236:242-1321(-)